MSDADSTTAALDARLMRRALRAAALGDPSPNPHVGAVVARGSEIISIGHHARCGAAHAEVIALQRAGQRARGATLYVTFEPCNHFGRTPPCTEAIVASGVKRVVIGCADPAPHVPGSSDRLRKAGIDVLIGVEQASAERMIADFAKLMLRGLPHVTLKAAATLDGRIATRTGDSRWITGEVARKQAHRMRARADAVLVGVGTVLADDPELTVRHVRGRDPLRVVLDAVLRTPLRAKLVRTAKQTPTLIFHAKRAPAARVRALTDAGAQLLAVRETARGKLSLREVLRALAKRDVMSLLVEGGADVHGAFLDARLADRASIFFSPRILADERALALARGRAKPRMKDALSLTAVEVRRFGDDVLVTGDFA